MYAISAIVVVVFYSLFMSGTAISSVLPVSQSHEPAIASSNNHGNIETGKRSVGTGPCTTQKDNRVADGYEDKYKEGVSTDRLQHSMQTAAASLAGMEAPGKTIDSPDRTSSAAAPTMEASVTKIYSLGEFLLTVSGVAEDDKYEVTFTKSGQPILEDESYMVEPEGTIFEDTPTKGSKTLVAYIFSGGAHCCTTAIVATVLGPTHACSILDLGHTSEIEFADVNRDGIQEIKIADWGFAYYGTGKQKIGFSFADSPAMDRLIVFEGSGWRPDREGEFPSFYESLSAQHRSEAESNPKAPRRTDEFIAANAIQAAYSAIMAGKGEQTANQLLQRLLPSSWRPELKKISFDVANATKEFNPVQGDQPAAPSKVGVPDSKEPVAPRVRSMQQDPKAAEGIAVKNRIQEYYTAIQQKNIDGVMGIYASAKKPLIKRSRLEAVAKDTEYYKIDKIEIGNLGTDDASALVYVFHKKKGHGEEYWEVNFKLIKEGPAWMVLETPGKKVK